MQQAEVIQNHVNAHVRIIDTRRSPTENVRGLNLVTVKGMTLQIVYTAL
jgi:hypothetical protein